MSDEIWRREVDNKLISHDKDIHSIAQSVSSIDESVKLMASLQQSQAIRDERLEGMVKEAKDIAIRAHCRVDEYDAERKKLMWLIITPIFIALLGLVLYKPADDTSLIARLDEAVKKLEAK